MFWSPFPKESLAAVPVVEEVAAANAKLDLVKIDTYRNQRIARRYGVEGNACPAAGQRAARWRGAVTGPMSRDSLEDLIKSI